MEAQIDAARGEVSAGGQTWPFELDCRRGTVAVDFGGDRLRLHPPSWRAKRFLARFAHLGERFLQEQFVRVALDDAAPMPVETAQRQALLALALWLGAPGGEPSLPLDARVLAAVTVQVCHAMRLAPGALDALDAADVELLWRASRGDASVAGDDSEGTRIVIVPAAPSDHPDTRPTIEREHAAAVGVRPERTLALDGAPSAPAVDTTRPHDAGGHFVGAPVTLETTSAPPTNAASSGREADGIAPASGLPRGDRFRLRLEGARPTSPVPAVPANASRRTPTVQAPPIIQSPASEAPAHTWPWPVTGVVALAAGPSLAAPDTDEGAPGARLGFAPQPRSDALRAAASSSSDPAAGVLDIADPLFDELAVRLEQAAGELGIDLEG